MTYLSNRTAILVSCLCALALTACNKTSEPSTAGTVATDPAATTSAPQATPAVPVALVQTTFASFALAATTAAGGSCALDAVNGAAPEGVSVATESEAVFAGWAAAGDAQVPSDARLVLTAGADQYAAPLTMGVDRPDVAAALSNEAAQRSGFNVAAKLKGVSPGEYTASISFAGDGTSCALNRKIIVAPAN